MTRCDKYRPSQSLRDYGIFQRLFMLICLITGGFAWSFSPWGAPGISMTLGAAIHICAHIINGDRRFLPWLSPMWRLIGAVMVTAAIPGLSIKGIMILAMIGGMGVATFLFQVIAIIVLFWSLAVVAMAGMDLRCGMLRRSWV